MTHIVNPRNVQWDFLTNDDGTLADVLGPNGARNYFMRGAVDADDNFVGLTGNVGVGITKNSSAIAMLIPSSGSIADNGALTLTTSIPLSGGYSWGCYMYFPANAVYSGSTAGFWYVVMSSNAAGTIYADRYTSGSPTIPTSPTAIAATGPGAYTQSTSAIDMVTYTITANSMGKNGRLIVQPCWIFPNNANNKTISTTFGASNIYAKTRTTSTQETPLIDVRNRGVATRQFSAWANSGGPATASTSGVVNTAIDTTADANCYIRGQLAVATDYIILESHSVELFSFT